MLCKDIGRHLVGLVQIPAISLTVCVIVNRLPHRRNQDNHSIGLIGLGLSKLLYVERLNDW